MIDRTLEATTLRRLAFAKLLYTLGVEQSRRQEPLSSAAVLNFHDAVEFFLQLAADTLDAPTKTGTTFMEYWEVLSTKVDDGITQKAAMKRLNKARVNLKHGGTFLPALEIESFKEATERFFAENTPRVFGVSLAEVSLVDLVLNGSVRDDLRAAQAALAADDLDDARRQAAFAFKRLLHDYDESLRDQHGRSPLDLGESFTFLTSFHMGLGRSSGGGQGDPVERKLAEFVDKMKRTVEEIREALKFVSLGLDYRRYARFQMLTPEVFQTLNDPSYQTYEGEHLPRITHDDTEFCIEFVIESALVLQDFTVWADSPVAVA
jgi:hypothetical protein